MCNDLCATVPELRQDPSPEKRVELHLHTKMSALDSVLELDKAVATAARWGHQAMAVTDHGIIQLFLKHSTWGKSMASKYCSG